MIVDDEELALAEYQEFMELHGIYCEVESDPKRALQRILASQDIAMVVTDLRMPGMSGVELISSIRKSLPAERRISFVIASGYVDASSVSSLPDVEVISKPVELDVLMKFVREGLSA